MPDKKCARCKQNKDISCFSNNKSKKDGLNCECKECANQYLKEHYSKNKIYYAKNAKAQKKKTKQWLYELKMGLKCAHCEADNPIVLDFHHIDPTTKEATVAHISRNNAKERILKEIAKCIVLCANCHRIEHWNQKNSS